MSRSKLKLLVKLETEPVQSKEEVPTSEVQFSVYLSSARTLQEIAPTPVAVPSVPSITVQVSPIACCGLWIVDCVHFR